MLGIFIRGTLLDPVASARQQQPLDTALICPACNSGAVRAREALTMAQIVWKGETEDRSLVPRLEDRHCDECGHDWVCTLPPRGYTDRSSLFFKK